MTIYSIIQVKNLSLAKFYKAGLLFYLSFFLPALIFASPITLISESQDLLTIQFELPEYELEDVTINGQTWKRIICSESSIYGEEGYPELKLFSTAIAVPVDGDISFSIESSESQTLKNVNIYPAATMLLEETGSGAPATRATRDHGSDRRGRWFEPNTGSQLRVSLNNLDGRQSASLSRSGRALNVY